MADFPALMRILSTPRANGTRAERETGRLLQKWLDRRQIHYHTHTFRLYPFLFESIGLWLILSRSLLALSIILRWGWPALPIAVIGQLGGLLDSVLGIPLVSWFGRRQGRNILVEFDPSEPRQELLLTAHYDSKTELLDHHQRLFFLKNLRLGILLTLALGALGPLDRLLYDLGSSWAYLTYGMGIIFSLLLLFLSWGLGLNLSLGRLAPKSQGAVDDGAACAILLGLAERLAAGKLILEKTRVTLALFTAEEVNMQGSRAYVRYRDWPLPAATLNLEVMAQDGEYVFWELDGTPFRLGPTSPALNQLLIQVVSEVTGGPPHPAGPVLSDASSFLRAGIPAAVLGTYDRHLRDRGFHKPSDNLERVVMDRLPEGVEILERFVRTYDQKAL